MACHFNPRSPHGERPVFRRAGTREGNFNPRSPHGERHRDCKRMRGVRDISIHAPRTGSDAVSDGDSASPDGISIHAPRTGSDVVNLNDRISRAISIHAPRTGSDVMADFHSFDSRTFQSTLPARGATETWRYAHTRRKYFNPRSPHGERRLRQYRAENRQRISIHAPRTGSDARMPLIWRLRRNFNPRSPHGERPGRGLARLAGLKISIHAPRTGSDGRAAGSR